MKKFSWILVIIEKWIRMHGRRWVKAYVSVEGRRKNSKEQKAHYGEE
jgi:hypothetical protein